MAIHHAAPGEIIDVRPYGRSLPDQQTTTLIKTDQLEVLRLVLPAGKAIPPHRVSGEITVQCLEGSVEFIADGKEQLLESGQMLYLSGGSEHALQGVVDASVLVTILL